MRLQHTLISCEKYLCTDLLFPCTGAAHLLGKSGQGNSASAKT